MKAVVCVDPGRLAIEVRPDPVLMSSGDVEVAISHVGYCGTDFHIFAGKHPFLVYPRVIGHELSALVVASNDPRFSSGDLVIVNPYLSCGACSACLKGKANCCVNVQVLGVHCDGGMCERLVLPGRNLVAASGLSARDAAMVEFLAIGAHAVRRAGTAIGQTALVIGAGPIGMGVALFARRTGARVALLDTETARLLMAKERFGFEHIATLGESDGRLNENVGRDGFDVVFDATGSVESMNSSIERLAHGGTCVFVGVTTQDIRFPHPVFHKREATLLGSRNALAHDFEEVMASILDGSISCDALNTHGGSLFDTPSLLPRYASARGEVLKAVVAA